MDRGTDAWPGRWSAHGQLLGRRIVAAIYLGYRHRRSQRYAPWRNHSCRHDSERFHAGCPASQRITPTDLYARSGYHDQRPERQDSQRQASRRSTFPPPRLRPFRSVVAALPRRAPDPVRARPRRRPGLCRPSTGGGGRAPGASRHDRADRRVRQAHPAPMAQGALTAVPRAEPTQAALGRPEAAASPVPPADMGVASRPLLAVPSQRRRA